MFRFGFVFFLTLSACFADSTPTALHTLASPERFKAGDNFFKQRQIEDNAREALIAYRDIFAKNAKDGEAAWRLSMACHFVGMRFGADDEEKKALFKEGEKAGLASIALNPDCAACHFWTAINQALYGGVVGPFKTLFMLRQVRDHLEISLKLDPTYAYGGAYRLLGTIEQKLPGILGGDNKRAKRYFEKAIEAAPDEPLNYLALAVLLRDELNDINAAIPIAKKGLAVPKPADDRIEAKEAIPKLQDFLKTSVTPPVAAKNR